MTDTAATQGGSTAQAGALVVPQELQEKFGELIDLIRKSESMNGEERQYWVNILPVMTPDQIQNLRDILDNERKQLAAIDSKYGKELSKEEQEQIIKKTAEERREKRTKRLTSEEAHREEEAKKAEALFDEIDKLPS